MEQRPFYHCPKMYVTIKLDSSKHSQEDLSIFKPLRLKTMILNSQQSIWLTREIPKLFDHLMWRFPNFLQLRFSGCPALASDSTSLCSQILRCCLMVNLMKVDLLNIQCSPMLAVPLVSLQMEVARRNEHDIIRKRYLGNKTPLLIWTWRTCVQLCISSEGSLTTETSFLPLSATSKRAISPWLTVPEYQKTTGNPNAALGPSHSPDHGKTSGDEIFGVGQMHFHSWRRSKAYQDLEEWPKEVGSR